MSNWVLLEWGWKFWGPPLLGALNVALFCVLRTRARWLNLVAGIVVLLVYGIAEIGNAVDGCYPWSPKEVEFRQGMTLCPGQSAMGDIGVPLRVWLDGHTAIITKVYDRGGAPTELPGRP
jgi:hypothetical protein